jgi:hypothetical protein
VADDCAPWSNVCKKPVCVALGLDLNICIYEPDPIHQLGDCIPTDPPSPGLWICDQGDCVEDMDDDHVPDSYDNCPGVFNPDQTDSDSNGTGDACETSGPEPDTSSDAESGGDAGSSPEPDASADPGAELDVEDD